jgi:DNA-directed RNA polymerase subunit L
MKELDLLPGNYVLDLDKKNDTDDMIVITTEDFRVRNKENGNYLTVEEVRKIFPPFKKTNTFIDFARLRPRIGDSIPGEHIKLTCEFSVHTASENSMFNVVSKCTYGYTLDHEKIAEAWQKQEDQLRTQDSIKETDLEFKKKNFMLLDAQRIYKENSFDFQIQTVGVYDNREIVKMGARILYEKFLQMAENLDANLVPILNSETTMDFSFDVLIDNEDYTMGKTIEYFLYEKYYVQEKTLSFCGFKKFHPHDTKSTVRLAFTEHADKSMAKQYVRTACMDAHEFFKMVYKLF